MDSQTPRRFPDGVGFVHEPDTHKGNTHPLEQDETRTAEQRRRTYATTGRLGDRAPRPATWSAPRKPSEG